eukprot:g37767.t1
MQQEGTAMLLEHLAGGLGSAIPVSTQLDIAPQHHLFMMGRNGNNIKHIMQRAGAQIHFPDPSSPQKKSTVYLQGTIESCYYTALEQVELEPRPPQPRGRDITTVPQEPCCAYFIKGSGDEFQFGTRDFILNKFLEDINYPLDQLIKISLYSLITFFTVHYTIHLGVS